MATRIYQGRKFDNRQVAAVEDALTLEEALQININGKPLKHPPNFLPRRLPICLGK